MSLSGVPDLSIVATTSRDDAPTMQDCRAAMRAGTFDLQTPESRAMFGLTFLRIGTQL
jgi:hypothetical protein